MVDDEVEARFRDAANEAWQPAQRLCTTPEDRGVVHDQIRAQELRVRVRQGTELLKRVGPVGQSKRVARPS
eukprot:scaffold334_cov241-Pinguiococcus_pyrenoidosus.AAC.40